MTVFLTSHIGGSVKKDGKRIPSSLLADNDLVNNLKKKMAPTSQSVVYRSKSQ